MCKAVEPTCQGDYDEVGRLYGVCKCSNTSSAISFDNNIIRLVRIFAPYRAYRGLFKEALGENDLQALRKATNDCTMVGSGKFQTEIAAQYWRVELRSMRMAGIGGVSVISS